MDEGFRFLAKIVGTGEGRPPDLAVSSFPTSPSEFPISAAEVKALIKDRRIRDEYFNADLFADPAWDMLLELFHALLEQRRVATSNLCDSAAVPHTTALRWITTLKEEGLIVTEGDRFDARRKFVSLSMNGMNSMGAYFERCAARRR